MREIRFRAWDIEGGRMEYKLSPINLEEMFLCHTVDLAQAAKEHDHILMQFTGLKDKNGKEIYEGDILRDDIFSAVDVVKFGEYWEIPEQGAHGWYKESVNHHDLVTSLITGIAVSEVVGNIHEHPELLEGKGNEG